MSYLFGDSSEANIDFNYLAFLREVIDCAAVLCECEATIASTVARKRTREHDAARVIAQLEELGKRASESVVTSAKDTTPVGRCASSIAAAIKEAVERETSKVERELESERTEMDADDHKLRGRARDILDKLLRTHDLPGADTELEVAWTGAAVKATMRQRTSFGVEAVLALDIPASSMIAVDLRVDRVAEGVEVHAHEAGGWLKKSDKLVALKLGRYHIAGVTVGTDVVVRLRSSADASAPAIVVTAHRNGDVGVTSAERELIVEERDRPGLRLLAARLEAAAQTLEENRTGLDSVEVDGKSIAEHEHPRLLAERLIQAIAPTVKKIAQHSRSPGELVLRRMLGDNRREEIFLTTADLMKRVDALPAEARTVFAPLELVEPAARPRSPTTPLGSAKRAPSANPAPSEPLPPLPVVPPPPEPAPPEPAPREPAPREPAPPTEPPPTDD